MKEQFKPGDLIKATRPGYLHCESTDGVLVEFSRGDVAVFLSVAEYGMFVRLFIWGRPHLSGEAYAEHYFEKVKS